MLCPTRENVGYLTDNFHVLLLKKGVGDTMVTQLPPTLFVEIFARTSFGALALHEILAQIYFHVPLDF